MLIRLARLLQIAGLVALPAGMVLQLLPAARPHGTVLTVWEMLLVMVAGVCLFWMGRLLEGTARRP